MMQQIQPQQKKQGHSPLELLATSLGLLGSGLGIASQFGKLGGAPKQPMQTVTAQKR